jgi:hypothetical protein
MFFLVFLLRSAISSPIRAWENNEEPKFLDDSLDQFDSLIDTENPDVTKTHPVSVPDQTSGSTFGAPPTPNEASDTEGLTPGAIAGIVIGVVLMVVILAALIWFFTSKRAKPEMSSSTETSQLTDPSVSEPDSG